MNIKPKDKTIKSLLISGSQFIIPRFQREYSWDKKNYQEFIDDMLNCLSIKDNKLISDNYFLGTMLFIGDYSESNNLDSNIYVVDGQQRITSITILFSALSDRFREIGEDVLSEQVFRYIMTQNDDGEDIRILESKTHYPYFSFYIQDREKKDKQPPSTEEEEVIKESFIYFHNKLDEKKLRAHLSKTLGSDNVNQLEYKEILKTIRDQVLGTTFISISTPDKKNANKIFEILNAKGKQLSHVDLIKNKIFEIIDEKGSADYAEVKWDAIKKILVSRNESVGLATYYRHFWISTYKKSSANKLYDDFIKIIKPQNRDKYKEFLVEMEDNAKNYIKILNPSRQDYENRKEYFWLVQSLNILMNYFNIVQVRIALLALFKVKDEGLINTKKFKETIQFLENFHFAYNSIVSGAANRFETIYAKFAIEIRKCKNKSEVNTLIDTMLITLLNKLFPNFEQFSNGFIKLTFTKKDNPSNVKTKYAIQKLNSFYEQEEIFSDLGSIEHIVSESSGNNSCNIGNLIILEQRLNNEADNLNYSDKKKIYLKSSYNWIKEFTNNNDDWEIDKIESRAKELSKVYYTNILGKQIHTND
ncbi:DUF262 and DUF1524 domain-containing protein [Arcobacter venerupis]|uniref:DUF262 and DUF1524 domain-containing protein n=1 Tax=Arcobacter venerupis TaxID=1054033 RepID=A0AAE7BC43_9BACT|nr:DUF262 domain-containing protein [Arcobacter venerupis]QKF67682.1 DUF262 and DUF1524 domain-containing protein [Arcobacter venerupis]RWS49161.1 hypothetical protein CKA56_10505 [Arcobacter venerupis]